MTVEDEKNIHVMPVGEGIPIHACSTECWCEPELNYRDGVTGKEVWVHREIH